MRRRDWITLLGGAAAWPVTAPAQGERMRRIGVLDGGAEDDPGSPAATAAFRNIARPEGNTTGFTTSEPSAAGKSPDLLKEAAHLTGVAVVFNPDLAQSDGAICGRARGFATAQLHHHPGHDPHSPVLARMAAPEQID
jgi:hypothetical protein